MSYVPGLSSADSESYTRALLNGTQIYFRFLQMTLSHVLVNTLDTMKIDGQINVVDGTTDGVTRTLQMGFLDPDHALRLDSDSPSSGMGGVDRLVQVATFAFCPDVNRWIGAYAFTGRPSVLSRNGDTVTVEAQDKSCLHRNKVGAYTIAKNTNVVAAIRSILARNGEVRFRFPAGYAAKLPAVVHVGGADDDRVPWKVAFRLAASIGLQLYFDNQGFACLRVLPMTPTWTLRETGDYANMLAKPAINTDLTTIKNRVVATGKTKPAKKGAKAKNLIAEALPPITHPYHPAKLAQNGVAWVDTEYVDAPNLYTQAQLNARARAVLNEKLIQQVGFEGRAMPWWHSSARDYIDVQTGSGTFTTRLDNGSFPLGPSADGATIGFTWRVRSPSAGHLRG